MVKLVIELVGLPYPKPPRHFTSVMGALLAMEKLSQAYWS